MTTADTRITKSDAAPGILAQFQTQVTDFVNSQTKWALDGTNPFVYNSYPGGYYLHSTSWGSSAAPLKSGQTVTTTPDPASLPDAKVLASQVETAMRNAVTALSNVRNLHLRKYYYNAAYTPILWADYGTVLGHLTDNYRAGTPPTGLTTNTTVDAGDLDSYVNVLDGFLAAHRASTVDFTEYWCHSACHSSHDSRNRR